MRKSRPAPPLPLPSSASERTNHELRDGLPPFLTHPRRLPKPPPPRPRPCFARPKNYETVKIILKKHAPARPKNYQNRKQSCINPCFCRKTFIPQAPDHLRSSRLDHCLRTMVELLTDMVSGPVKAEKGCQQKNVHSSSSRPSQKLSNGPLDSYRSGDAYRQLPKA